MTERTKTIEAWAVVNIKTGNVQKSWDGRYHAYEVKKEAQTHTFDGERVVKVTIEWEEE